MVIRKFNHDSGYYISAINKPDFCSIIRFSKAARHIIFDDKVLLMDSYMDLIIVVLFSTFCFELFNKYVLNVLRYVTFSHHTV